jgi:CelD/BcsL family acetyltransferase involved in cellulose biosynthesis/hydroxymethylpyrimidine pyrophosphatase-like HAD family hydrolase
VEGGCLKPSDGADSCIRAAMVSYIAERAARLALARDPYIGGQNQSRSGWVVLSRVLSLAYDPRLRRFAVKSLRARLRRYVSPCPAFIDGNMLPGEWIRTAERLHKVDFASHAFGKSELNVCDPAYDLAMALETLELSPTEKAEMLSAYRQLTGDTQVEERLVLCRILYAARQLERANYELQKDLSAADRKAWHYAAVEAKKAVSGVMEEFCVQRWFPESEFEWTPRLFFLDLDGVLYKWRTGYPTVTRAGLESIARLRDHEFSILPNSRRGVEAVRRCCELYRFPGGVAEFGSVLLDVKNNREIPLASEDALEEIARCRQALNANAGMLLDHDFRYSIRVMRIEGSNTKGLSSAETADLLQRNGCRNLTFLTTTRDTYITDKEVNKGTAVAAAKRILGLKVQQVFAIGDSEEDLSMLQASDKGYVVAQSSGAVRRQARRQGHRVLSRSAQQGLAEAVEEILSEEQLHTAADQRRGPSPTHLLDELLNIADCPSWRQILSLAFDRTDTEPQNENVSPASANENSGQAPLTTTEGQRGKPVTSPPENVLSRGSPDGATVMLYGQRGLATLLPGWLAAEQVSTFEPMQHANWTESWAECFNQADQACFLTVGLPENPIAIAPMVEAHVGGVKRLMQAAVRDIREPLEFPLRDPAAATPLAQGLIRLNRPLLFNRVWADSPLIAALRHASDGRGWFFSRPTTSAPFIPLDSSWQNPESHLNAGRRSDLRRARRHAEQVGPVRFEVLSPRIEELDQLLEEAYRVEAAGWKGNLGSALLSDKSAGNFYRRYAAAMCRAGKLRVAFMRIADRAAAMQLCLETAGSFWLLKVGYDEAYARSSPGMLLMQETIRYSACRGLRTYEFLGTNATWTQMWSSQVRSCVVLRFYPRNAKGVAAFASDACHWSLEKALLKLKRR